MVGSYVVNERPNPEKSGINCGSNGEFGAVIGRQAKGIGAMTAPLTEVAGAYFAMAVTVGVWVLVVAFVDKTCNF